MSLLSNVLLVCVLCIAFNNADDLQVGSSANGSLGHQETVKLSAMPMSTRTEYVFYNSNNAKTIKGISAIDIDKTKAKPTITAGGVGSTFVNLRLTSERGSGLHYQVQIFV